MSAVVETSPQGSRLRVKYTPAPLVQRFIEDRTFITGLFGVAGRSEVILRHTMTTTLLANGCPIGHIRVLLGHAHLSTTCRYYLGVLSDREAKSAHGRYLSYEPELEDR